MSADPNPDRGPGTVTILGDVGWEAVSRLLARLGLRLRVVPAGLEIPGSYWGAPEAGLVGHELYARFDTPVHSVLHEASHYVCMTASRRRRLDRDAGGDDLEESAVCYLSIVLAEAIPGMGRERMFLDMDRWGYSFRLGSTRPWFETDAEDARQWLHHRGILDPAGAATFRRRDEH